MFRPNIYCIVEFFILSLYFYLLYNFEKCKYIKPKVDIYLLNDIYKSYVQYILYYKTIIGIGPYTFSKMCFTYKCFHSCQCISES